MGKIARQPRHEREIEFARYLESEGKTWIYEPKIFYLEGFDGERIKYTPDFYCPEDNTYYEVAGSRQAFSRNKQKYFLLASRNPSIKFAVVKPNGFPYRMRHHYPISPLMFQPFEEFRKLIKKHSQKDFWSFYFDIWWKKTPTINITGV